MKVKLKIFFEIILLLILTIIFTIEITLISDRLKKFKEPKPILSASVKKAETIFGPVKTRGRNIFDRTNKKVVIKGINYDELVPKGFVYTSPDLTALPDVCKIWNAPPTRLDAKQVVEWGFNTVRIPINWHSLERKPPVIDAENGWQHIWDENYLAALDDLISDITKNNLAIILDMHQYLWSPAFKYIQSVDGSGCSGGGMPEWLYPDSKKITFQQARCDFFKGIKYDQSSIDPQAGFIEVWKFLIEQYKDNPQVIGANIINEPWSAEHYCTPADLNLDNFYLKIGTEIQKINPDILLILEDSQDNEKNDFSMTKKPTLKNAVYSFHLYTYNFIPDGKKRLDKYYQRSQNWELPLFIGEYDGFGEAVNGGFLPNPIWQSELERLMDYMKKEDMHWAFWSYSGYYSLLQPGSYEPKEDLLMTLQRGF